MLPEWQGHGLGGRAALEASKLAKAEGKHRYFHAYPKTDNGTSNMVCRKAGFTFGGEFDFEYPKGHPIVCNDWYLDLATDKPETT